MNKIKNNTKLLILVAFLTIFFSQFIFWGTSGLIAEERKNNIVVTPLSLTGTGTYLNPYLVNTNKDLNNLCAYTNSGGNTAGVYFKLTSCDLNADGAFVASLTEPIGTATYPFMGIFDGDNITLTGASFATNANNQAGIFGQVKNATIQNLTVAYNSTNTTATTMGGIVASAYSSNIINCTNKTDIYNTTGDAMIAGIVGYAYNLNIKNCTNQATIKCLSTGEGISSAGGIVGYGFNTDIIGCKVIPNKDIDRINGGGGGSSSSTSYRGGISGNVYGGKTEESYNMLDITASGTNSSYAGGIVGYASNHAISNCFNRGRIKATANETTSTSNISNSQSSDKVSLSSSGYTIITKTTQAYAGGIAGYSSSAINYCYSIGSVSGGRKRVIITNNSAFNTSETETSGFGSHYNRNGTIKVTNTSSKISSTLSYDNGLYFSGINGYPGKYGTNCYSSFNNLSNSMDFVVNYEKSYSCTTTVVTNSTPSTSNSSGVLASKNITNNTNKAYSEISVGVDNHRTDCSNTYAKLSVDTSNSKLTLTIGTTYNYTTGALWWKEDHHDPKSITAYSVAYSRVRNYDMYESGTSSKFNGSDKSLPSGFSNKIWAFSSIINNGYPHLVKNYWQDSAKK